MVVAMLVLVIAIGLATVALNGTLDSKSHATRDLRSQRALQAADAGIDQGIYRFNQVNVATLNFTGGLLANGLTTIALCTIPTVDASGSITGFGLEAEASVTNGACKLPSDPGHTLPIGDTVQVGNHGLYEMQQIGGATASGTIGPNIILHPKVVAVGVEDAGNSTTCASDAPTLGVVAVVAATKGCVVRRVLATLAPIDPFQVVEATGKLTLNGAAITVTGDMRANGDLAIPGVCPVVCLGINAAVITGTNVLSLSGLGANITYGAPPSAFTPAGVFTSLLETYTPHANSVNRTPVTIDDTGCPSACVQPSLPSGVTGTTLGGTNGVVANAYDATKNTVTLTSNNLVFTPGDYILCDFKATGGSVSTNIPAASTTPVRIFIDSPTSSRCSSNGLGGSQGNFTSSVGVANVISGATALIGSSQLQIYLAGNGTAHGTQVTITGPALTSLTYSMFLYAPLSDVTLSNAALVAGNYIGDDVTMSPLAGLTLALTQNVGLNNYTLANGVGVFHVAHYTECTPVYPLPEPDPTVGC
ncbi:MAG: hypothetical protein ACR2KV_03430 [Solirubrobacteraceae bacterium]